jgi:hypothetical protein
MCRGTGEPDRDVSSEDSQPGWHRSRHSEAWDQRQKAAPLKHTNGDLVEQLLALPHHQVGDVELDDLPF